MFFDELGPPWPKHACTDHRAGTAGTPQSFGSERGTRLSAAWWDAGWRPLLKVESANLTPELVRLEGRHEDEHVVLYVPRLYLQSMLDPLTQLKTSPIQAQISRPGVYRVEVLGPSARPLVLMAFSSMGDALNHAEQKIPIRAPVRRVSLSKKNRSGRW